MANKANTQKILGIDPGTTIMGYAAIEVNNKSYKIISVGVVHLNKLPDHYTKLKKIFEKISTLIDMHGPEVLAIEAPFFGKNVQSMLKLGRAQGVAIAAAMVNDIEVYEYAPKKIKQSITGNGNASKDQVSDMLQRMLNIDKMPKYFDATDALGVAICHHLASQSPLHKLSKGGKAKNWSDFIKSNPDKIKKH